MTNYSLEKLKTIHENFEANTCIEKPCKVINVHSQHLVDVEFYDNNKSDILYKVPVKHQQTASAFVFLSLKPGDRGTVRFLDNDINNYLSGSNAESTEAKKHNINDGIFCLGFYPEPEQYIFPQADISIGNTAGTLITVSDGTITVLGESISVQGENLSVQGSSISITGGDITLSGNTEIDGRKFLQHTHPSPNGNTGGVI